MKRWALFGCAATIAVIAVATLMPFTFRSASVGRGFSFDPLPWRSRSEVVINVALFVPFGFCITALVARRHTLLRVAVASALVSGTVEIVQLWLPRHPGVADILTNVAGGLVGYGLYATVGRRVERRLGARWRTASATATRRTLHLAAGCSAIAGASLAMWLLGAATLASWDRDYSFLVGNEKTGDRPFEGTVFETWLSDEAAGPGSPRYAAWRIENATRSSDLRESAPDLVRRSGAGCQWLESERPLGDFAQRVRAGDEMSIGVRFTSARLDQLGPTRIVSFSEDTSHRNLTIGQQGSALVVRLRTSATGENGTRPELVLPDTIESGSTHEVTVSFRAGTCRVWVDAKPPTAFELNAWNSLFDVGIDTFPLAMRKACGYGFLFAPVGLLIWLALRSSFRHRRAAAIALCVTTPYVLAVEWLVASTSGRGFRMSDAALAAAALGAGAVVGQLYGRGSATSRPKP